MDRWRLFVFAALTGNALVDGLGQPAYQRLPTGSITPTGWLREQLKLQAEGLSGHLAQFWPNIMDSVWIGGKGDTEGGLHELTSYWLNGFVPLAYLLKNANITALPGVSGIYHQTTSCSKLKAPAADCRDLPAVRPLDQVDAYVQEILKRQNPDGWLGPDDGWHGPNPGDGYWSAAPMLLALLQYAEAEPSMSAKATNAVLRHLLEMKRRLVKTPLSGWTSVRWVEIIYAVEIMLASPRAAAGNEAELQDLLVVLQKQGDHLDALFLDPRVIAGNHNVNTAEALKSAAVEYLASNGSDPLYYTKLSRDRMHMMDEYFGLPTGAFVGDEEVASKPTHFPSRGTELCGITEDMFSYELMFAVHGDVAFADRVERLAYNALPATWASPKGGDMWAHQYLQSVNQIKAINADPHVWPADGPLAETYGLEPNYGCCTGNFNQGWPKFANAAVYTVNNARQPAGVVIGLWAPMSASTSYGHVEIVTAYPFADDAQVIVTSAKPTNLYMRIPSWASEAEVPLLGGRVANGTMVRVPVPAGRLSVVVNFNPKIRLEASGSRESVDEPVSYSVHRGALMYSLPIGSNWTTTKRYYGEAADYEVRPTTPWAYALDADPAFPEATLTYGGDGYTYPSAPFNRTGTPCHIKAIMRPVRTWSEENNSAAMPPASPACLGAGADQCGKPGVHTLVPHGSTVLRIGSLPLSGYTTVGVAIYV
eukprot:TRINITY_DN65310_c0_g1_i1.p1 TRINITY_DN65310_c0_g1~~TRINITY_DN65310_c0_g1_i1.p1  ORF type:complete len:720 (-),score=51.12 TRINITY_DN65310_c0_g1_i1:151-2271(-)